MLHRLTAAMIIATGVAACGTNQHRNSAAQSAPLRNAPAQARTVPFEETVFDHKVSDPYRWMEDEANATQTTEWVKKTTAFEMAQLAQLPGRHRLRDDILKASRAGVVYRDMREAGGKLFALRLDSEASVFKLIVRQGGDERVLFDPAAEKGETPTTVDTFAPSPSGNLIAVHTAAGGAEIGPIRFLDVATGQWRDDEIRPVWGEFYASWFDDSAVLFTRMGPGVGDVALQHMQGGVHYLGRPVSGDKLLLEPPAAVAGRVSTTEMPLLMVHRESSWVTGAFVGATPDSRVAVARAADAQRGSVSWREVATYDDHVSWWDMRGDWLYAVVTKDAPNGEVRRIGAAKGTMKDAALVLPGTDDVLSGIVAARDGLYVVTLKDGVNGLLFLPDGRTPAKRVDLEPGTIAGATPAGDGSGITFGLTTWTRNTRFMRARAGVVEETPLASATDASASHISTILTEATSADGTRVPLTILAGNDLRKAGAAPTLLDAYGGYGLVISPNYDVRLFPWIQRGGVYAVCGVRGGGDKGRAWYDAGRGPNKPNGHADLIACAERLIELRYADQAHLAVTGTSAGGVMAPPAALKRPDLFRVVLSRVGLVNPTRLAVAENGPNQFREMGDPQTPDGFAALLAQDAYLMLDRVNDSPDWFITVGLNDHRVAPWMNAKFAAKALRKFGGTRLVFVRADADVGHGIGTTRDQEAEEWADAFSFLLNRFGAADFQLPSRIADAK
jgi:prolyl oligopeptidase